MSITITYKFCLHNEKDPDNPEPLPIEIFTRVLARSFQILELRPHPGDIIFDNGLNEYKIHHITYNKHNYTYYLVRL